MDIRSLLSDIGLTSASGEAAVVVPTASFADMAQKCVAAGAPLVFMYATDERADDEVYGVHAVFSVAGAGFLTLKCDVSADDRAYPSLTRTIMAAHWYERLIHDQFGIVAQGHPDWRRLIHHENIPEGTYPLRKDFAVDTKLPHAQVPYPMHAVEGTGIYEIPVGPIHAGIIEPGHFRFNVRGERILSLEGKLFFTHKGIEKLVEGKLPAQAFPFIERISGDMPVAHTLAFAEAVERACRTVVPKRARALRVVWSELERITMHIFDIGNIAGNGTGFTFMAAQGFRMVEELRRLHASLTGHRFLRGAIMLGGAHDISPEAAMDILNSLKKTEKDLQAILDIAFASDGLMERFETTGVLSREAAIDYGARGPAARASGVGTDVRRDHPYAGYTDLDVLVATEIPGDVAARFKVRVREIAESLRIIRSCLEKLPSGEVQTAVVLHEGSALGWAESWRGAIIDWVRLDEGGRIDRCAISDPSFMNWALFGEIGPGNIVPDFPLCNKSLNLSYSGTDL